MRKVLIAFGVLVLLAVVVLLVLPRFIDAEAQRRLVSERLEQTLHRKVKLGEVRLSLTPPALQMKDLEIAEDPAFGEQPFLTAGELRVRVNLLPLLRGQLEVPGMTMEKPTVRLVKNARGEWNVSSLAGSQAQGRVAATGAVPASAPGFNIASLDLADGTLNLVDQKAKSFTVDQLAVRLNNLAAGQSFNYDVSLHLPGKGKGLLKTEGQAGPLELSQPKAIKAQGKAQLQEVDLQALAAWLDQPGLAGLASGEVSYSYDGETAPLEGTYSIAGLRLNPRGGPAQAPVSGKFKVQYHTQSERLDLQEVALQLGKSFWNMGGRLDFARGANNEVSLRTTNAHLPDVGKLLPALAIKLPAGSSLSAGSMTGNLLLRGAFQPVSGRSNMNISNARLSGYSLTQQLALVAKLVGVPTGPDTEVQKFQGDFNLDHGNIRSDNMELVLPGMTVTGAGTITEAGGLDLKMNAILTGQGGVTGLLQKVTGGVNQVPFFLKGTMEKPVIQPDVSRIAKQQIENRKDTINKVLGGFFGRKKQQ